MTASEAKFEDVMWEGDVGTHDCVGVNSEGTCVIPPTRPVTDPQATEYVLYQSKTTGPGQLLGNLTLTWDEASPLTTNLIVSLVPYTGCPSQCSENPPLARFSGRSPLAIPLADLNLTAGALLGFYLQPPSSQVGPASVSLAVGQPVTLQGQIGLRP